MFPEQPQIARLRHRMLGSRRRVVRIRQPLGPLGQQIPYLLADNQLAITLDIRRDRAVAAEETMFPEQPQIARLRHRAGVVQPHSLMLAAIAAI
jgi:hypothetical protein